MLVYLLTSWLTEGMDDFEIRYGERLPAETRMEMPEMSYEQELIMTPVPFENRVEYLSDFVKPHAKRETIEHIAKALGVSVGRAERMAEEVGAVSSPDHHGVMKYEHFTREIIEEELEWQRLYDQLDEYVSAGMLAYHLAKSKKWIREHSYGAGIYPERRVGPAGRVIDTYPKIALPMLRTILLHTPPANDWYTTTEVETILGRTKEWIDTAVAEYGLQTERRISALAHRETPHYPEETLKALHKISQETKPAGEWLTETQIAEKLGKSNSWVNLRLQDYEGVAEERLDDASRRRVHYSPEVIEVLRNEADGLPEVAGDWLTANGIAKHLKVTKDWVDARIGAYQELGELRLYTGGKQAQKEAMHYPPEVLNGLKELKEAAPPLAGGWLTVNMIALRIGRSFKWVDTRIGDYYEFGGMRQAEGSNQPTMHYPPSVLADLERRSAMPGRGN